jgi:hypothetical protein
MTNHHPATILDVGARKEKIRDDALTVDVNARVGPDVCASAEYLPFREKSFECVTYLELIEHLDSSQIAKAFSEANRVAGYLILSTPNTASRSWNLVWYFWSRTFGHEWNGAHKSSFTPKEVTSLVQGYGFDILSTNFSRWSLLVHARTKLPKEMPPIKRVSAQINIVKNFENGINLS